MLSPNLFILYVSDPVVSAKFYAQLLGRSPEGFPTYQCFTLDSGMVLGLWSTNAKDFVSDGTGHRSELAFQVENEDVIKGLHAAWVKLGVTIEQDLHAAAFGLTFVALDLDGHRIRVNLPDG